MVDGDGEVRWFLGHWKEGVDVGMLQGIERYWILGGF